MRSATRSRSSSTAGRTIRSAPRTAMPTAWGEAGPVGPQDWPVLRRLARAGKLTYRDQASRELASRLVAVGADR
jgi:hypothetical protein